MFQGRESYDSRPHGANNSSTRRSRNGSDRQAGRGASATYSASGMTASVIGFCQQKDQYL